MPKLELVFSLSLIDHEIDEYINYKGPIFHRWVPNGELDALDIDLPKYNAKAFLWFERRGYIDRNFIKYKYDRKEFDENVMVRQALLDGGFLFGKVILTKLTDYQFECIVQNDVNNKEYLKIAKMVVKHIIDPILEQFSCILRDLYGQYWIAPPKKFDSRQSSLSQHCDYLNMQLIDKDGKFQHFFKKESENLTIRMSVNEHKSLYKDYLCEKDWKDMKNLLELDYIPPLAATLISNSNRLYQEGKGSYALIESITALELAIEHRLKNNCQKNDEIKKQIEKFGNLPLPTRMTIILLFSGMSQNKIELALNAIEQRNKIVHEGTSDKKNLDDQIKAIFEIVRFLLDEPFIRCPETNIGNELTGTSGD